MSTSMLRAAISLGSTASARYRSLLRMGKTTDVPVNNVPGVQMRQAGGGIDRKGQLL